jgi:hypothetical protein
MWLLLLRRIAMIDVRKKSPFFGDTLPTHGAAIQFFARRMAWENRQ